MAFTLANDLWGAALDRDDHRHIEYRQIVVGKHFVLEAEVLRPLPVERFDGSVLSSLEIRRMFIVAWLQQN